MKNSKIKEKFTKTKKFQKIEKIRNYKNFFKEKQKTIKKCKHFRK